MQIRRRQPNPAVAVEYLRYQVAVPDAEPRNILEKIVWHKEKEIDQKRERMPLIELQHNVRQMTTPTRDFASALRQAQTRPALIAEVKKASPSKGVICENFDPVAIAEAYVQGGAACLSVLTDEEFFQGSFAYLRQIRETVDVPLLCKDFVIYPYQIFLARLNGADAVLLIAAILSDKDLQYFLKIVASLGMAALVEVHTLEELDRVLSLQGVTLIGINNRNLEDFSVDLQITADLLSARRPAIQDRDILIVSESGLFTGADLNQVAEAGANAVLIGESLVKHPNPAEGITALFAEAPNFSIGLARVKLWAHSQFVLRLTYIPLTAGCMDPIPLPSHIHYELLLQLLERQTMHCVGRKSPQQEQLHELIVTLRKAFTQQKHLEESCARANLPIDYRWSLNQTMTDPTASANSSLPQ